MRAVNVSIGAMLCVALGATAFASDGAAPAPVANDGRHDFDFLIGAWEISNRSLAAGSSEWQEFPAVTVDRSFLGGLGNMDEMTLQKGGEGISIRFFDPVKKEWSIYWASTNTRGLISPPVIGHFEGGRGRFYSDDVDADNKPIRVRYTWEGISATGAHWDQAFSYDGGKTWKVNWNMEFHRRQPPHSP